MAGLAPAKLIDAVRRHADAVLAAGRNGVDGSGTPLLPDAIDPETGEAVPYDARDVAAGRRLSNVATQQEFLRTLVALTRLTGDDRYRTAAVDLVEWFLEHCTDDRGLPYWGGHVAYDLDADEVATNKNGPHELKFEYPFYELFWQVDPDATRRLVEAFWTAHVLDWSILDFNRHGDLADWQNDAHTGDDSVRERTSASNPWDRTYEGGDVFFWGDGLTFVNTGSDLYYAAGRLAELDGDDAPLAWAKRLARRYVETRGETGISGYQFSQHPSYCNGPAIRGDRAQYQFAPYIRGDDPIYEGTLFRPRPIVQRRQLELSEHLGDRGESFERWALEELRAWREVAYRPERNDFKPLLTDGRSLEGFVIRREGYFGPKGRVIGSIEADADFFWTYAAAYRTAGDETCWQTARDIGRGIGLGDIGSPGGTDLALATDPDVCDYRAVYGLLDLHCATGRTAYLEAAARVGERVLEAAATDVGPFVDAEGRIVLENPVPLALLHLAATLRKDDAALPTPIGDRRSPEGGI